MAKATSELHNLKSKINRRALLGGGLAVAAIATAAVPARAAEPLLPARIAPTALGWKLLRLIPKCRAANEVWWETEDERDERNYERNYDAVMDVIEQIYDRPITSASHFVDVAIAARFNDTEANNRAVRGDNPDEWEGTTDGASAHAHRLMYRFFLKAAGIYERQCTNCWETARLVA